MTALLKRTTSMILLALVLTGCASTGQYNGYSKDPMRLLIVYNTLGLPLTSEQKEVLREVILEAARVVDEQLVGSGSAIAAGGFSNAFAAAVAVASTVSGPLGSVMAVEAALSASGGVVDARTTFSYGRVYAIATIADTMLLDRFAAKLPRYKNMENVRIVPAFTESTNTMDDFKANRQ